MKNAKKINGFSLMEVIIATTIMSIVMLGVSQVVVSSSQSVSYLEDRLSSAALKRDMIDHFKDEDACLATFSTKTINLGAQNALEIKDKNGSVLFDPNNTSFNTYDGLRISNVYAENVDIPGPNSDGLIEIVIEQVRRRTGGGGDELKPIRITKKVALDASNQVSSCSTVGDGSCLDVETTLAVGALPVSGTFLVGANVKTITVDFPTVYSNFLSKNQGDIAGGTCGSDPQTATIHLGKTKLGGKVLQPGKVLHVTPFFPVGKGKSRKEYYYDGVIFASYKFGQGTSVTGGDGYSQKLCYFYELSPIVKSASLGAACPSQLPAGTRDVTLWKNAD